jgi:hypothetical protein
LLRLGVHGIKPAMTGSRKILLVIAALAALACVLPDTRDQFCWWWAQSHNHSDTYLRYLSEWPKGRHMVEARAFYQERLRAEAKRAQILQAYTMASMASPVDAATEEAYNRERAMRRDNFFWRQATNANTIASCQNYLVQFPLGSHADEARQKIQALSQSAAPTNTRPQ